MRDLLRWVVMLACVLAGAGTTAAGPADEAARKASESLYGGIREETLPNGLRIYLKPIPGAATVTTKVAYKVGSADEDLAHTGLSHYLEHLMFKGTAKLKPGDIDRLTQKNGGRNNAYTSEDMTVYHFDFAADRWEVALEIEADRMRNLRIDKEHEFEQEKGAVVAELKGNEDNPWDLEYKLILPRLFGAKNPYGHPIIGEEQHVVDATAEVIKGHYDRWYHPNNAALVVVGGFDPDKTLARIKDLFGPIPAGKLPERTAPEAVRRDKPDRQQMQSKFEVPRLLLGYNTIAGGHPDFHALEVAEVLLTGGKTGRLYQRLVEKERLATAVEATNNAGRLPGWFSVQAELLPGKGLEEAEKSALAELKRLADEDVPDAELARAKRRLTTRAVFGNEDIHDLADGIARAVTNHDLAFVREYLPKVNAVTAADVRRVAGKYLVPDTRVVLWSKPAGGAGGAEPVGKPKRASVGRKSRLAARDAAGGGSAGFNLADARRHVLPNGLTVILLENHRLPILAATALVRNVRLSEPAEKAGVATLTGGMLDEGTADHAGGEIAGLIEDAGGDLTMSSNGGAVKVLAPDRPLGLGLLVECLSRPTFPADAFDRVKDSLLSRIEEAETDPQEIAQRTFASLVFGPHPLGRSTLGTRPTAERLTAADCKAFHARLFVPNNTAVAVVGDFDSVEVLAELTKLTEKWQRAEVERPALPAVEVSAKPTEKIITVPDAAQLHIYLGHVGVRRDSPDYYKLLVMDNILGTGPGFTDRLSAELRDRRGLAYTVTAQVASSAGEEPGAFTGYIGTYPDKFTVVRDGFLTEVNRIRKEAPTPAEVEGARQYLLGSLPFRLTDSERVAEQLLTAERFGLGFDWFDKYRKSVSAVTPEEVRQVAEKYLKPDRLVLVAAGPVDAKGKPLPPPKE